MAGTVMFLKGLGDVVVGAILSTKPQLIYESAATQALHAWTGLPLSSAEAAPSFNHAIACMVIAIGAGSMVASAQGPQARIPVVIMNAIWGLLACLTCVLRPQLGSATMVMTALNHCVYSLVMLVLISREASKPEKRFRKED